ncbi:putative ATP-dependent endonuclease of OLD family [Micromonospora sp. Llam0]|uniref:ATP-dependent nuclease n=1 Tax=Micromonospora sp. Llam0 TaxID=2485143 RepID=UPI000F914583|nr:AAA family ATPase [Micromonospora sp. Llam0]ROO62038.1 putative ATP-dependent endonuclease of OLD family [Micromonospora sp. Llam0]
MRFRSIKIQNFRSIENFEIDKLGDLVVIAGPNGCGKSSVLDAIRLLKSSYGGYKPNEWKSWFQEFNLDINKPWFADRLLRDRSKPLHISASIELAKAEIDFIRANLVDLIAEKLWRESPGHHISAATGRSLPQDLREQPRIIRRAESLAADMMNQLSRQSHELALEVSPKGSLIPLESPILELAFGTYLPASLGIFEFQSASRTYIREKLNNISLDLQSNIDRQRDQTLYDSQAKYRSIKSHLVTDFLHRLLSKGGAQADRSPSLNATVTELFQQFFPNKVYLGPEVDLHGSIQFPVRLTNGDSHDIDELSSGEKEIVYGYLRLKSAGLKNSVILVDEPELHLNPALLRHLPDFYHKHLGVAENNQIWLITHSDVMLRHCAGHPKYSVFYMSDSSQPKPTQNQATPVLQDSELAEATRALVGDLTTYRPYSKVVIVEGEGFDTDVISRLFPEFAQQVNIGAAGDKKKVRDLASHLRRVARRLGLGDQVFSICDKDFDIGISTGATKEYHWAESNGHGDTR